MTLAERRVLLGQMAWDHQGFQFRCFLFFTSVFNWENDGTVHFFWQVSPNSHGNFIQRMLKIQSANWCTTVAKSPTFFGGQPSSSRLPGALHVFVSSRIWKHGDLERQERNHWQVMKCPKVMSSRMYVENPPERRWNFCTVTLNGCYIPWRREPQLKQLSFVGCSKKAQPLQIT